MSNPLITGPYDPYNTESHHCLDQYDMHNNNPRSPRPGDSLGGGFDMFFCYNDVKIVEAAKKMWYWNSQGKYVGQRHPELPPEDNPMSRDHYTTTLLTLKLHYMRTGNERSMEKIKEIQQNTGYIISKMARRTFTLALWSKAIQGKKFSEFLYYILEIIIVGLFYVPVHKLLGAIANFTEEVEQEDWKPWPESERLQDLPKYKQVIDDIMYPAYAMELAGWQLYVLDGFPRLRGFLKRLHRPMISKTNRQQMMLFGMKNISRERIEAYKPMKGGRSSGWLCNRNDRNMRVLDPSPTHNNKDVDQLRLLYNHTQL